MNFSPVEGTKSKSGSDKINAKVKTRVVRRAGERVRNVGRNRFELGSIESHLSFPFFLLADKARGVGRVSEERFNDTLGAD